MRAQVGKPMHMYSGLHKTEENQGIQNVFGSSGKRVISIYVTGLIFESMVLFVHIDCSRQFAYTHRGGHFRLLHVACSPLQAKRLLTF